MRPAPLQRTPAPAHPDVPEPRHAEPGAEPVTEPATESVTPPELVARATTGDNEAFAELFQAYRPTVQRFIQARVRSHSLAEDLTSETFLRALRRIGSFTWQGRDIGAWLITIARNLVADHYKSGRYRMEICTDEALEPGPAQEGPEHLVLDAMTRRTVREAITRLGDEQRQCLTLRFLRGLSVAETAQLMGKNEGAIKALQYRAVRSLARLLPGDIP